MDKPTEQENQDPLPQAKARAALPLAGIFSAVTNIFASAQNIIGIDIGSSTIKIVQLQKNGNNHSLINYITRNIPRGLKDDPEEKNRLIRGFVKEFALESRVKTSLGRMVLSGKGVFLFSFNIPLLNKKDLRGVVSMELKKRLPFQTNLEAIHFDFFSTGQSRNEKGLAITQITCIACDKFFLEEQVALLKEIGLRPMNLHVIADCLGNLLPYCVEIPAGKIAALLDVGAASSALNFYKDRELLFSREIPIAGEHFTAAMTKTLPTEKGALNISAEEAEKIKRQCGIPLDEEAKTEFLTDFGILTGEQISSMLRPNLERMLMEINRTFSYFSATFKRPISQVDGLYLTGGSSRLKNFRELLRHNLKEIKKIEHLNPLKAVKSWKETGIFKHELVMEQAAPHLSAAFGLCLGGAGKINLIPAKEKIEQKAAFLSSLLKISFPLILGGALLYCFMAHIENIKFKDLIEKTDGEIKRLSAHSGRAREYIALKLKLDERRTVLERAGGRQPFWYGIFKELSNITSAEVILRRISLVENKEPKQIRLEGKIFSKYTIVDLELSQYTMSLEDSPFFYKVQIASSKPDMYSPIPAAEFEITAFLTY